ncbi:MAG: type II secretion system inner membrane protein GspF [Arenicellales bacterium]
MGAFEYQALDPKGRTRKGISQGDSARHVRQLLREQGLVPLAVVGVQEDRSPAGGQGAPGSKRRARIATNELAVITRQFATLLASGLTIEETLTALVNQAEGHQVKSVLSGIRAQVVEGRSLADAIESYPRSFPEIYKAAVAAGEQSGSLALVLDRLADFVEGRQTLKQRVSIALIYPVILTIVSILIVAGLLSYVVPKVVQVFQSSGQQLPLLTRILIAIGDFLQQYGLWILGALSLCALAFVLLFRLEKPRFRLHKLILGFPGVRRLSRGLNTARMARTLSIMVNSGVPLLTSMRAAEGVLSNVVLKANLSEAAGEVAEGVSINRALARRGNFPPLLIQMVASGEASGQLGEMLEKAATVLERELEARVTVLVSLFEPFMILFMGAVVLMIVLAILLPIFDLNQLIG